jgi:outer membrane protein assembly factor BamB
LDGFFYCLDARTGQKVWEHDLKSTVWGSPYWVDGKVYIGNEEGDVTVFAHGREKKVLTPKPIEMKRPIKSTPVVVNGVLYVMTDSYLYAIANP